MQVFTVITLLEIINFPASGSHTFILAQEHRPYTSFILISINKNVKKNKLTLKTFYSGIVSDDEKCPRVGGRGDRNSSGQHVKQHTTICTLV